MVIVSENAGSLVMQRRSSNEDSHNEYGTGY